MPCHARQEQHPLLDSYGHEWVMIKRVEAVGAGETCAGEDRWRKGDAKGMGAHAHEGDRREKRRYNC
jgi:hypothetical protein